MSWVSKRESGFSSIHKGCLGGGPVVLKRRTSGRGRALELLSSVTKVRSDCVLLTGSVSAVKADDIAQSSHEEQYFSGDCGSLSPSLTSAVV